MDARVKEKIESLIERLFITFPELTTEQLAAMIYAINDNHSVEEYRSMVIDTQIKYLEEELSFYGSLVDSEQDKLDSLKEGDK